MILAVSRAYGQSNNFSGFAGRFLIATRQNLESIGAAIGLS
jgi:hypothetical protein